MNRSQKHSHARQISRKQPEDDSPALLARHMAKSLLITIAAGMILLLAASLCAYFFPDPDQLILPLGLAASLLTALIGGFCAVRIHGHSALVCGLCNGSLFTLLMILVSLFFKAYSAGYSATVSCLLHAAFLLLSVAGAFLGLRKAPKKRKH